MSFICERCKLPTERHDQHKADPFQCIRVLKLALAQKEKQLQAAKPVLTDSPGDGELDARQAAFDKDVADSLTKGN